MALLDGSSRSATATAVDATETMVLFRQDFLDFLGENPELAADVNTMLVQRLRNVNQMLGDMVFLDVPTRVAKQLLTLAETYSGDAKPGDEIVVPMGQDELARLVGASRETVAGLLTATGAWVCWTPPTAASPSPTWPDWREWPRSDLPQPQPHAIISP